MNSIPRQITRERLFATFMELCSIDSEPGRERQMADHLRERLTALGCSVSEDRAGQLTNGNAGNLHARLEGTGPGESLFFSCHLDRVSPGTGIRPRIQGEYLVSDGTTVLGADDAAGLAAILEALTMLHERKIPRPTLEIVLTVAEELALAGARHFDTSRLEATSGFVLDAAGRVGEIVIRAPEKVNFRLLFQGKSAHAGFAPEQGVSAIQMAAKAISRMRLLRIDGETTVNLGNISATGASNIVPERCEVGGEARSLDPAKVRSQLEAITLAAQSAAAELGGRAEIVITEHYPAYQLAKEGGTAQRAARAARRIGVVPQFTSTGGGSDANIFNSLGKRAVVLSCGYEHAHTTGERISLEQLALLAEWVVALILDRE
jgi:tripeptide aminopeptidase